MQKETKVLIAAIQTTSGTDKTASLAHAKALFQKAVKKGAKIIAFPENLAGFTPNKTDYWKNAESTDGPMARAFSGWAKNAGVWLIAGSVLIKNSGNKVTNTTLVFNPQGKLAARYDKIHLFDANVRGKRYQESDSISGGKKIVTVKTEFGVLGFSICFDLRFPKLYQALAKAGAEIVFIPSAFTVPTGRAHWDSLTRTRAIETQTYVIAPAQWGTHYPGRSTYGHTRVIDPWGKVLGEKKRGTGVIFSTINLRKLHQIRALLPTLKNAKI